MPSPRLLRLLCVVPHFLIGTIKTCSEGCRIICCTAVARIQPACCRLRELQGRGRRRAVPQLLVQPWARRARQRPRKLHVVSRDVAGDGLGRRGAAGAVGAPHHASEKVVKLVQKLGQLQPLIAVFPQECMGQLAYFGPT